MPVVLGIVRAHKGALTVESEPGVGTVFRVYFPLSSEKTLERQPQKTVEVAHRKEGRTILLVDDDIPIRHMVRNMLSRLGYSVIEANDGVEAVEIFRRQRDVIRCVLTDLTMPGVFLTARPDRLDKGECMPYS